VQPLLQLLNVLLPLGYLLAVVLYATLYISDAPWSAKVAPRFAQGLAVLHGSYLVLAGVAFEHVPVANTWEGMTFIAFALTVVYIGLEWRLGIRSTGAFLLTPALVFQILSSAFVTHTREVEEILRSSWFGVHVTSALMGFAALAIAAVYGGLYVLLYRSLKGSKVGLVFRRLPSLDVLGRLNWHAMVVGWAALTLAIVVGIVWVTGLQARGEITGNFLADPKFVSTVAIWGLYGLCLAGRLIFRWPSRRLATVSLVSFVLMLCSTMMITVFLESFHRFG
jgi:ABC-type transport system involved in cytochrome c biogenesis permease subunit